MSADNYAVCPRCRDREQARLDELGRRAQEAYGKVPVDEFDELRREADQVLDLEKLSTFREDYEFYGAETGEVVATYGGSCSECGLEVSFTHRHPFYEKETDGP